MSDPIKIFAERRTSRLQYAIKTIFEERLGLRASFTSNQDELLSFEGARLNYSNRTIPGMPRIIPATLLFEKRLQEQHIQVSQHHDTPLLFQHQGNELGHDPLAAVFYMFSRFEEYFPYRADAHGRFPSTESFVHRYEATRLPLADIYIQRLKKFLQDHYPFLKMNDSGFMLEVTIDVDQMFMYRAKGIARSMAGTARDLAFQFSGFKKRMNVILGQARDPLDIYDDIISKCKTHRLRPVFFFQVGETSRFDINNPIHLPYVKNRINDIAMEADIGVHPSYYSSDRPQMFDLECERLRSITSVSIDRSRQHYLRFRLPSTFRKLEDLGVRDDYSMGFPDINGFRASTSMPYQFFDLERDEVTAIRIHPLVYMDMLSVKNNHTASEATEEARRLMKTVKDAGGIFSTVWHPEVLLGLHLPFDSEQIFDRIIEET